MHPVLTQIASIIGWFVVMVVVMSIVEHQVHCRLMHKTPRLAFLRNLRARQRIFTSHAVEHHTQYRKEFHDDPVPHGDDIGIVLEAIDKKLLPIDLYLAAKDSALDDSLAAAYAVASQYNPQAGGIVAKLRAARPDLDRRYINRVRLGG